MPISQLGITAVVGEGVGAEIREVAPESIAAFSRFRVGDVITAIDGSPVKSPWSFKLRSQIERRERELPSLICAVTGSRIRRSFLSKKRPRESSHSIQKKA